MENQTVKDRIISYINYLGISNRKFEKEIGKANGFVNSISDSISTSALKDIVAKYPNLNKVWLVFGEGDMLINNSEVAPEVSEIVPEVQEDAPGIPDWPDGFNPTASDVVLIKESKYGPEALERTNYALHAAFLERGMRKKTEQAEFLGVNYQYYCSMTTGREILNENFVFMLMDRLKINPEYIMTGEGEIFLDQRFDRMEAQEKYVPFGSDSGNVLGTFDGKFINVDIEKLGDVPLCDYILNKDAKIVKLSSLMPEFTFAYKMQTRMLEPKLFQGDILLCYKTDAEKLVNMRVYLIDTKKYGKMIKRVDIREDSYLLSLPIPRKNYPLMQLKQEDIHDFYEIVSRISNDACAIFSESDTTPALLDKALEIIEKDREIINRLIENK